MRFGRLMCFWQSLRPHFLCRYCDRKSARSPPKPIASVVRCHSEKLKDRDLFAEKSLTNCPFCDMKRLFAFCRLLTSDSLFGRTIPRRLSKERFWFSRFRQWLIKTETWKWRLDNFSVFSGFLGLRAEVTFRKWKSGIYESEKSSGKCIVIIFWVSKGFRAEVTLEKETPEFRNVTIRAEIETLRLSWRQLLWILTQFCRNSVWILFWESFYNYLLRNIFFEDWKLKIIALIYGRFDLRAFA